MMMAGIAWAMTACNNSSGGGGGTPAPTYTWVGNQCMGPGNVPYPSYYCQNQGMNGYRMIGNQCYNSMNQPVQMQFCQNTGFNNGYIMQGNVCIFQQTGQQAPIQYCQQQQGGFPNQFGYPYQQQQMPNQFGYPYQQQQFMGQQPYMGQPYYQGW